MPNDPHHTNRREPRFRMSPAAWFQLTVGVSVAPWLTAAVLSIWPGLWQQGASWARAAPFLAEIAPQGDKASGASVSPST